MCFPLVGKWLEQYIGKLYGRLTRFKRLALEGPGRLLRTHLAISVCTVERTYVCICQQVIEKYL